MKKVDLIISVLKELKVKGLFLPVIAGLLDKLGIGQLLLISKVTADDTATKALSDVLGKVGTVKKEDVKVVEGLPDQGFTSFASIVNFAYQLKADQVEALNAVIEEKGIKLDTITTTILDRYTYRR